MTSWFTAERSVPIDDGVDAPRRAAAGPATPCDRPAPGERLHSLDGLRGVAALVVVAGHLIHWLGRLPTPRNYLAVDLFFLMSGFVLGRVYEPRFAGGWTTGRFLINRYIRLYPLYLLGTLLGAAAGMVALLLGKSNMGADGLAVAMVAGVLLLPSPTWGRTGSVMPLDNPGWSLHFELVANLLFALGRRWLNNAVLSLVVLVCGAGLIRGFVTHQAFGGYAWDGFGWGYVRVGYSFALGLLMHRVHPGPRWRGAIAWLPLFAAVFVMLTPYPNGWFFEGAAVLVLFPAILWAAVLVEPRHPAPFVWLGLLSYPLYVTHSPLLHMAERAAAILHVDPAGHAPATGLAFMATTVAVALLLDRVFDVPVRRWLTARLSRRPRGDSRRIPPRPADSPPAAITHDDTSTSERVTVRQPRFIRQTGIRVAALMADATACSLWMKASDFIAPPLPGSVG